MASRWQVLRLVPGHASKVVLLSEGFFPITTHFWRWSMLCPIEDCRLCELLPSRGLFYVAAQVEGRIGIVEMGAQSAGHLEQHCKLLHQGMRPGLEIVLQRKSAKKPVYSEVVGSREGTTPVAPLDLAARVMALYKCPCPQPGDTLRAYAARLAPAVRARAERVAGEITKRSAVGTYDRRVQ